jgi:hypothetical protein
MSREKLRQFQAEQIQLLGNNLNNAAQVLNNIEDRGYSYDDVKLEWYRGQLDVINSGDPRSIELVKQLNSFINNLRLNKSSISQSIAGVKEVEHPNSPLSSDAVHQKEQREKGLVDERHRHFYNYVLKFPFHEQHAMLTDYFRKVTGIKANIILLHGISKEILLNDAKIPKFEIFTQHLLPGKIKKASDKIPPAIVGYTKSLLANDSYTMPWWILKQLCGENNIDDTNQKVQFFNTVKSILEQKSLVIPYVIETKSNVAIYETIKGFITDYWTPLVEEIRQESIANKDKYNNNSLLLLLLNERNWQSDDTDLSFEVLGSNITHNSMPFKLSIQICPINHDTCSIWIDDSDGFFINYDIYDCFTTNWQQPNYIPECGTIEGLLEKITSDIFGQEISFYELLKKAKIN